MINARVPGIVARERVAPPIKRVSPRTFLVVCVLEGLFIAAILGVALYAFTPQRAPLARSGDYAVVREAIWARVNGSVGDPLLEISPGVTARESNLRGLMLHGETYYYYFEGQRGFDPLSLGKVDLEKIEVVARDEGGATPLVIYRLRGA